MWRWPLLLIGLASFGCDDDGPPADPYRCMAAGGEGCFEMPTDVIGAADSDGTRISPALDCDALELVTSSGPVSFSGHTVDYDDGEFVLPAVRIEAFSDHELTARLWDVTSDTNAVWSTTTTVPNVTFVRTTASGQMRVEYVYARTDVTSLTQTGVDYQTATRAQAATAIERAGDRFLPGKSQLRGIAHDCAGNRLVNVIVNIAPASGKNGTRLFEAGTRVYYGVDTVPASPLGRRTEIAQTSTTGVFGIANISPGIHYVQLWGFPDAQSVLNGAISLKLLDEKELIVSDTETQFVLRLDGRLTR